MTAADTIRRLILEQSYRAGVGHIGSALSVADIVAALYMSVLKIADTGDGERDRFILSKGHAALALYAALHLKGWISAEELNSYCGENTLLGVHPEHGLKGIDFSTGSLGHGLSMGTGAALAARMQRSRRRVFVLVSDAECNEGSLWEAVMFAAHHGLANLVAIVDDNGQQALGASEKVMNLTPLAKRFEAFGWEAVEVDGHDERELARVMNGLETGSGKPHVVVAKTACGKGVSYMERQVKWHYWPMTPEQYQQALREIGAEGTAGR